MKEQYKVRAIDHHVLGGLFEFAKQNNFTMSYRLFGGIFYVTLRGAVL